MNNRTPAVVLVGRMFVTMLVLAVGASVFFNGLSGRTMLPLPVAVIVAAVLTFLFVGFGWFFVSLGSDFLLRRHPRYQQWKAQGGRPYWDSLPKPINPDSDQDKGFWQP